MFNSKNYKNKKLGLLGDLGVTISFKFNITIYIKKHENFT